MTNQVNQEAFKVAECWSSSSPKRKVLVLADSQQKITYFENHHSFIRWVDNQASESEINSLKEQVNELQSHLSSQSIEIAKNDVTLESYAHKVAELQADNNQLREALKNIIDAWECLSEGSYAPSKIQMWLIANMKPAINSARKVIEISEEALSSTSENKIE